MIARAFIVGRKELEISAGRSLPYTKIAVRSKVIHDFADLSTVDL